MELKISRFLLDELGTGGDEYCKKVACRREVVGAIKSLVTGTSL